MREISQATAVADTVTHPRGYSHGLNPDGRLQPGEEVAAVATKIGRAHV